MWKFPGILWQVWIIFVDKRKHPSASGSGQGPQSAGELREPSCLSANSGLMLFMVRSSRGLARRRWVNKDRKSGENWKDGRKEREFNTKIMRQHDQKGQTKENSLSCHV